MKIKLCRITVKHSQALLGTWGNDAALSKASTELGMGMEVLLSAHSPKSLTTGISDRGRSSPLVQLSVLGAAQK